MSFQPTESTYKKFGVLQEQPQDMRGMFPIRDRVAAFVGDLTGEAEIAGSPSFDLNYPKIPGRDLQGVPNANDPVMREKLRRRLLKNPEGGQELPGFLRKAEAGFGGQEVAMTEKEEDKMLLRSLQRGEMGSGKNIDKAIQDLINKINGVGVRGV